MRPSLLAVILLAAAPAAACGASPTGDFDLLCRGQMTRNGDAQPFATRLHVDLATRRFCANACLEVFHLSDASSGQLAYHYDVAVADADHAAGRYRGVPASSAGPYSLKEDIVVDRRTGAYSRTYHYRMGDPVARGYDDRYVGQCRVMPYTGLAARAG